MKKILLLSLFLFSLYGNAQKKTIPKKENTTIYSTDEIAHQPEFITGTEGFYYFFNQQFNRKALIGAPKEKLSATATFIIEKDGSLSYIKILKDPGFGFAKEALRILKTSPKWKPGLNGGQKVRTSYSLPITINP